ncbi:N-carbamoyl-L-amino acid hydrolase [uncultured Alphaproteobacteria bacterium]|uniref:N-carbamoyl-L-amino acid hydrolase n=1 Tax=uncultured Alphaproteobacteria bacterium TaxID=91750 RepID=A0A212K4H4_9PROT|nr:N-carbamoyl-L-amino acid hydrolase [uncultured Alphaproteobacteria bacterium]
MIIDRDRLWADVEALARFTRPESPWTRRAFTPEFDAARTWLRAAFAEAGLTVRLDACANLIGRREGSEPGLPVLMSGSHCDTVPAGGRFDGIAGVLAALAFARALNASGTALRHPFEVVDFLSEEPSDYGVSSIGSRAIAGRLSAAHLAMTDGRGETLAQAIARAGGDPAALGEPLRRTGEIAAYVELHIEQGRVLETANLPIGVVDRIVGIARHNLVVTGRTDHAGSTPMDARHDALAGAARVISAVESLAREMTGNPEYVVATVGRIAVSPNAANAVPGRVEMVLDLRAGSDAVLAAFPERLRARCDLGPLGFEIAPVSLAPATDCAPAVTAAIAAAADRLGLGRRALPSGAGHDAVNAALLAPTGMIFIPCRDGRSHVPEEWSTPEQLYDGARVLAETLFDLDRTL